MDTFYYLRTAMAGWIFLAVLTATLAEANAPTWQTLLKVVRDTEGFGTLVAAFAAAVVGVGAPPAVGFTLERVVSSLLWVTRKNQWKYACMEQFGKIVRNTRADDRVSDLPTSAPALFHVGFYSYADPKLVEWARRRRAGMYASLTSALAIVVALSLAVFRFHAIAPWVAVASVIVALFFVVHGGREQYIHETALSAWVNVCGPGVGSILAGGPTANKRSVPDVLPNNAMEPSAPSAT